MSDDILAAGVIAVTVKAWFVEVRQFVSLAGSCDLAPKPVLPGSHSPRMVPPSPGNPDAMVQGPVRLRRGLAGGGRSR